MQIELSGCVRLTDTTPPTESPASLHASIESSALHRCCSLAANANIWTFYKNFSRLTLRRHETGAWGHFSVTQRVGGDRTCRVELRKSAQSEPSRRPTTTRKSANARVEWFWREWMIWVHLLEINYLRRHLTVKTYQKIWPPPVNNSDWNWPVVELRSSLPGLRLRFSTGNTWNHSRDGRRRELIQF